MGVTVGDNAHHLGIAGAFLRKIFNAFAGFYLLGNTFEIRIHTICRNFFGCPIIALIHEIGVVLLLDSAVDGQITQLISAVINVHFAQRRFYTIRGPSGGRKNSKQQNAGQKH